MDKPIEVAGMAGAEEKKSDNWLKEKAKETISKYLKDCEHQALSELRRLLPFE